MTLLDPSRRCEKASVNRTVMCLFEHGLAGAQLRSENLQDAMYGN